MASRVAALPNENPPVKGINEGVFWNTVGLKARGK
jgi:hypothetical protein